MSCLKGSLKVHIDFFKAQHAITLTVLSIVIEYGKSVLYFLYLMLNKEKKRKKLYVKKIQENILYAKDFKFPLLYFLFLKLRIMEEYYCVQ